MKRRLLKLGLLLLLGAIINVAVASISAQRAPLPLGRAADVLSVDNANALWKLYGSSPATTHYPPAGWEEHRFLTNATWFGTSVMVIKGELNGFAIAPPLNDVMIVESGVPARSLRHVRSNVVANVVAKFGSLTAPTGRIPPIDHQLQWMSGASFIWPGFAINTLFYAAIFWLLFFAPCKLRRWRRIRRGLCPACAYPVGTRGGDKCTECGTPVLSPSLTADR